MHGFVNVKSLNCIFLHSFFICSLQFKILYCIVLYCIVLYCIVSRDTGEEGKHSLVEKPALLLVVRQSRCRVSAELHCN